MQILGLETLLGSEDLWPLLLGITVVPTVLQMALLPFCPESPRFLYIVRCQEHHAKSGEVTPQINHTVLNTSLHVFKSCTKYNFSAKYIHTCMHLWKRSTINTDNTHKKPSEHSNNYIYMSKPLLD